MATGGQAGDGPQALPLLAGLKPGKLLADTAYDSDETRAYCAQHPIEAVIPNRPNRLEPAELDEETYRDRNKIERFFGRMKQYRRLATRYEKTIVSFLAFGIAPQPSIGSANCPHALGGVLTGAGWRSEATKLASENANELLLVVCGYMP